MTAPVRLRLSRAKGFDLQAHSRAANGLPAMVVARPGPFGNPFVVGRDGTRAECVRYHCLLIGRGLILFSAKATMAEQEATRRALRMRWQQLSGHNLACWCALNGPCHADTLLEAVANMEKRT
ncbi:DUF4326 domain-containing protein [Aurantimonas sp. A2-1-M11]|uniref:DUF4326 domain-containing protein n=1 Tax=Aurantimonas sp. A2-1-M11 TaxID=3113712 RepID=UPI002F91D554